MRKEQQMKRAAIGMAVVVVIAGSGCGGSGAPAKTWHQSQQQWRQDVHAFNRDAAKLR